LSTITAYTEIRCGTFVSAFVKPIFTILFFKVGIRTWRVRRGIVVIEIWFVNKLINIIQNHVGMNFFKQVSSIYVQKIKSVTAQDYLMKGSKFTFLELKNKKYRESVKAVPRKASNVFTLLVVGISSKFNFFHKKNRR